MRARAVVPIVLVLSVAAGCVSPGVEAPADLVPTGSDAEALIPLELSFGACSEQIAIFPLPGALMAEAIPPGFKPLPFDPTGTTISAALISYGCARHGDSGADAGEVRETYATIPVEPPAAYAAEGYSLYAVIVGIFTTSETAATIYEAWNATVWRGEVSLDVVATPLGRAGTFSANDGNLGVTVRTAVAGPPATIPAGKGRLFATSGSAITGAFDVAWTESWGTETGEAILQFEPVSPLPPPLAPGIALHYWGETYGHDYWHVPLATLKPSGE